MSERHLKIIMDPLPNGMNMLDFALMMPGGGVYPLTYHMALAKAMLGAIVQCSYNNTLYQYNEDGDCLLSIDNEYTPNDVARHCLGWRVVNQ